MNKKLMFIGLLAATVLIGFNSNVFASVTGVCSNCHTMHNSQNGDDMILDAVGGSPIAGTQGPFNSLIRINNGCAGCHADGVTNTGTGIPRVDDATNSLAGGYFTAVGSDANQHDALGAADVDNTFYDNASLLPGDLFIPGNGIGMGKQQIECEDCHAGGGHHANNLKTATGVPAGEVIWNSTTGNAGDSYRFLIGDIKGIEDDDWEFEAVTDHNTYYGVHVAMATDNTDTTTISAFCASCHEDFHQNNTASDGGAGDVSTATSWLRHPTDYAFQAGTEAAAYVYQAAVPAGTVDPAANPSPAGTNGVVTCLSCHRAHGSDQPDMLRFAYTMDAGSGASTAGCFACHTTKDV